MKYTIAALSFLLALASTVVAQSHQHTATTINGKDHPEQISDNKAWLIELIAESTTSKNPAKPRPAGFDKTVVTDFRTQFDKLTKTYNASLSDGKHGTTAADLALRDQFYQDVEQLLKLTVGRLQAGMLPADWEESTKFIQENKSRMTMTDDAQSAVQIASIGSAIYHPGTGRLVRSQWDGTTGAFAAAGYTTFSEVWNDGSHWHQIVHLYGTSTGQWTCEWNSYQGMWEPPGCPAYHDFYTSNTIDGRGWTNFYEGTAWNPAQYMSIAHELDEPVNPSGAQQTSNTDATVDCSVAGILLGPSMSTIHTFLKWGWTYEAWNNSYSYGSDGVLQCGSYAVCRNSGPYMVNLPYVRDVGPMQGVGCTRGFLCYGGCASPFPGVPWHCTGNNPKHAVCFPLEGGVPNNPEGECTPWP